MTPTLRPPVAVVLSRFPTVTETFILREVAEMERQGQPVRLVPLLRDHPPVIHQEARPWIEQALYTPFFSRSILRSNLAAAGRHPGRYFGLLLRLVGASLTSPRFLLATLALYPKAVHLARLLEEEGIGHVHAHFGSHPATAAMIISAFSRATYSVTLHAHDLFVRRYRPLLGTKLRRASFVRVISRFNRRTIASLYPGVQLKKVHVVHVGIRTREYLAGGEAREETDSRAASILSVAALRSYKGLPVLVDACARLQQQGFPFRAAIVGDGPMRGALERQIACAGLEDVVRLLGALPQHEVGALLRRRPIFVLPSVIDRDGWMDGIPVALMEAMAAGAPVIGSRLSGIPELVEDGSTGLLVAPGDADALAAAIQRLAEDPALARQFGERGREKVRAEFELESCTRQLLQLLDEHNAASPDLLARSDMVQRIGAEARELAVVGVAGLHRGPDARVLSLLVPAKGEGELRRLIVKEHTERHGQSSAPGERARHEFEVLERLVRPSGNGDAPLPVPQPVRLDQDVATVVMEACGGRPLSELLREGREGTTGSARARVAMEAAGAWLAALQARTAGEVEPENALALWRGRVGADMERCRSILPQALLSRVATRVGQVSTRPDMTGVGRHCDFSPGNLLVDWDRVAVIDFEGFGPGLPWEDAAYFLVQAELFFDYPLIRHRFSPLRRAFLSGYHRPALERDRDWAAFCSGAALQILGQTVLNQAATPGWRRRIPRLRRVLHRALA